MGSYTLYSFVSGFFGVSLVAQTVKNLPAMQETQFHPWVRKISWRREWQPSPLFLPGEFREQRRLAGYSPWGYRDSDITEQLTATTAASCFPTEKGLEFENPDLLSIWSPALLPLTRRTLLAIFVLYPGATSMPSSSLSTLQVLLLGVPRLLLLYDSLSAVHSSSQQYSPFLHLTASKKQSRCSLALMSAIEAAELCLFSRFLKSRLTPHASV